MTECKKYIAGSKRDSTYKALYQMIPKDDEFLHYRLSGKTQKFCKEIFFAVCEEEKCLTRIWMSYGLHKNSVANWGAVYTLEEYRGRGLCRTALEYCFEELNKSDGLPLALFCTAGSLELTNMYKKYGFVPALKGHDRGRLYRPLGDSPATFEQFCKQYYKFTDKLLVCDADFGWRNEIDCLLKFALEDKGISFGINGECDLWKILTENPKRAKVIVTYDGRCIGWIVDGQKQVYPLFRDIVKDL